MTPTLPQLRRAEKAVESAQSAILALARLWGHDPPACAVDLDVALEVVRQRIARMDPERLAKRRKEISTLYHDIARG